MKVKKTAKTTIKKKNKKGSTKSEEPEVNPGIKARAKKRSLTSGSRHCVRPLAMSKG